MNIVSLIFILITTDPNLSWMWLLIYMMSLVIPMSFSYIRKRLQKKLNGDEIEAIRKETYNFTKVIILLAVALMIFGMTIGLIFYGLLYSTDTDIAFNVSIDFILLSINGVWLINNAETHSTNTKQIKIPERPIKTDE